jgi:heptosyltransferase I
LLQGALDIPIPNSPDALAFPIQTQAVHELEAAKASEHTQGTYAILNPGGGWTTKLWNAEKFGKLADALWTRCGLHSLVTFGPGEEELAQRVAAASQSGSVQLANLSLKGFFALAKNARVYIGGDTGPTHLAVAARTPIVGLFGPTEWWRNGSPYIEDICVERTDIDCRVDCHRRACSNWICMDIDVERVLQAVMQRIGASRSLPLAG